MLRTAAAPPRCARSFPVRRTGPVSACATTARAGTTVGRGLEADAPPASPPPKPPTRAELLDRLFGRLKTGGPIPTRRRGSPTASEALWMQSGSPTADLLMSRAVSAANRNRRDVAAALFDKIVELEPGWAEAWNRRATLCASSMATTPAPWRTSPTCSRSSRVISGRSAEWPSILVRHNEAPDALVALRRALALDPQNADLKAAIDKLVPEVEGRAL